MTGDLGGAVRGQSTALEYTLSLAVASLVITGLLMAAGDFVTDQRRDVVRTELGVVGEQLAGEVSAADRLVRAGEPTGRFSANASLPSTVAGAGYNIEIGNAGSSEWLNLSASDPDVSVEIRLETETDLKTDRIQGGRVSVVYDPSANRLEVRG
ncbi:DUF7266 family protein [Halosimplex salinum]|uniref:DUF7266 family protein n=1 Tax=Halosimplex salinum TaxID=1710538 RepID=UPI0013DE0DC4|nr:hypothetical protein [Halosimplex salinum]